MTTLLATSCLATSRLATSRLIYFFKKSIEKTEWLAVELCCCIAVAFDFFFPPPFLSWDFYFARERPAMVTFLDASIAIGSMTTSLLILVMYCDHWQPSALIARKLWVLLYNVVLTCTLLHYHVCWLHFRKSEIVEQPVGCG
jgi:hypothetical protein